MQWYGIINDSMTDKTLTLRVADPGGGGAESAAAPPFFG